MRFDGRTVDENLCGRAACHSQSTEDIDPHPFSGPSNETVIERLTRPVDGRSIDPAGTGFQHVHNAADHPPIVNPRLATRVGRKKRPNTNSPIA